MCFATINKFKACGHKEVSGRECRNKQTEDARLRKSEDNCFGLGFLFTRRRMVCQTDETTYKVPGHCRGCKLALRHGLPSNYQSKKQQQQNPTKAKFSSEYLNKP